MLGNLQRTHGAAAGFGLIGRTKVENTKKGVDWVIVAMVPAMLILILIWIWVMKDLSANARTIGSVALGAILIFVGVVENVRRDRRRDEVQLAASRFGTRWALLTSVALALSAAFIPPVQSLLVGVGDYLAVPGNAEVPASVGMFVIGVSLSIIVQQLAAQALTVAWTLTRR